MRFPHFIALLPVLVACEHTPPLEPLDTAAATAVIAGSVVVVGPERPADTYVLLYDVNNPGMPLGMGSPVNFDAIPADKFEQDGLGSWSAPYAMSGVPAGSYYISGLHDTDFDFSPFIDTNMGTTCGDWGGAHVGVVPQDDGSTEFDTVIFSIEEGELLDGVPVAIQVPIPVERPAFHILDDGGLPATAPVSVPHDGTVTLASTAVGTEHIELQPVQDLDAKIPCAVSFPFYPQVSYDDAGEPIIEGFDTPIVVFTELAPPADRAPMQIGGFVAYDITTLGVQLLVAPEFLAEMTEIEVSISQGDRYWNAFSSSPGGDGDVADLPAGPWAVTVINVAGQPWTVPNEFGSAESSPRFGFMPATQVASVMFQSSR
jgi:hypothetical protein